MIRSMPPGSTSSVAGEVSEWFTRNRKLARSPVRRVASTNSGASVTTGATWATCAARSSVAASPAPSSRVPM